MGWQGGLSTWGPASLAYGLPQVASFQEQVSLASPQGNERPSLASWKDLSYGLLASCQGKEDPAASGVGVSSPLQEEEQIME